MYKKIDNKEILKEYKEKRRFDNSPEPKGEKIIKHQKPIFVVQEHSARNLHYDFRIEIDGVLKSWAIPKGPSTNPKDKRLAIETEDHPIDYAKFEGIIPQGHYGAGPVLVWDLGTFKSLKEKKTLQNCYNDGEILMDLNGKKLKGSYALIRTDYRGKNNWLFFKMKDEQIDSKHDILKEKPESVLSHKTIDELEKKKKK